ncbi:MAG TPA: hypothetical protein VEG42_03150 [Thermoplasmata archaeon]|nr:hypothetical protein [Thermoplasmata archaeon]
MDVGLELLVLKVTIAPLFIGAVSLIAQRYGHRAAGWLVALPINTGTIVFILTLTQGTAFASSAALGALLGIVSLSAFVVGYARSAPRLPWSVCLAVAAGAFVASTFVLEQAPPFAALDLVGAVAAVVVAATLLPKPASPVTPTSLPRWEIPLRMLTAAVLVVAITSTAEGLGPRLSGLLSPIPVFTITLVIFTHSRQGPAPVFVFLEGLLYGLFSFAAFCVVVGVTLVPFGLPGSFAAGLAAFFGVYALVRAFAAGRTREPSSETST